MMMRRFVLIGALSIWFLSIGCRGLAYRNPTENMMPTITPDDMCVVNPLAYSSGDIQRFDIVVFEMQEDTKKLTGSTGEVRVMMRVIGLPGERVERSEEHTSELQSPM